MRADHKKIAMLAALPFAFAAAPVGAEWVDWIAEAEVPTEFNSNVNRSAFSADVEWGVSWNPRARLGRVYQLGESTRLAASAEILGEIYTGKSSSAADNQFTVTAGAPKWSRLNSVAGDGQLSLFHKFGLGPAPWARVSFSGGYKDVQDIQRSGARFLVGADVGKRFCPRFDATLGYLYTNRQGRNGGVVTPVPMGLIPPSRSDVFTQQSHQVTIQGNFLATEQLLISTGFSYRRGDFDSNSESVLWLDVVPIEDVKAATDDNVFGGWVYRIVGNIYAPFVSLNYGLGDRFSIDAGYRFERGEGKTLTYDSHIARLSAIFRY